MKTCCGMVNICIRGEDGEEKNLDGYIVDECERRYHLVMRNGEKASMPRLTYDNDPKFCKDCDEVAMKSVYKL